MVGFCPAPREVPGYGMMEYRPSRKSAMNDAERAASVTKAAKENGMLKASPTIAAATAFLRWYFRNTPDYRENARGKDLYELTNGTRRWRIKKRVLETESKGESGNWIKTGSTPLIETAQRIIAKRGSAEATETVKKAAVKRQSAQKKAAGARERRQREEQLMWAGMKAVAEENPGTAKAAALRGDRNAREDLEASARRRGVSFGEYSMKDQPVPERDEWVASIESPQWAALVWPLTYRWVQRTTDGGAVAIKVSHESQGHAEVSLTAVNEQLFGVGSHDLRMKMLDRFWKPEEIPVERGYISGRVQIMRGRVVPVLTFITVSGEKRRGSGSWLVRQWCRFVKAWGVDDFVIEAPGNEGQPFFQSLIDRGDLALQQKEGAYWRVSCRFGATRSIPFDMFGDVSGYTPPPHIPTHGPRTWTLAASLRSAPSRVHVAAIALLGEMLSPFFEGDDKMLHIPIRQRTDLLRWWDWLNHMLWKMAERQDALPTSPERAEAMKILSSISDRWSDLLTHISELPVRAVQEMARFIHDYRPTDGHELTARTISGLIKTLWGLRHNHSISFGDGPLPVEDFNHILAEWWVYGPTRFSLKEGRRGTVAGAPSADCTIYNVHEPSMGNDTEFPFDRDIYAVLEEAEKLFRDSGVRLSRDEHVYEVCLDEQERVVAVSSLHEMRDDAGEPAVRFSVAVLPAYRRHGHARALVERLVQQHGDGRMEAWVVNEHMLPLLESFGFESTGREWSPDTPFLERVPHQQPV